MKKISWNPFILKTCMISILCVWVCLCMWHLYYKVSYSNVVFLSFRFVTLLRVFSFSKGIFNFLRQKNINSLLFLFFLYYFMRGLLPRNPAIAQCHYHKGSGILDSCSRWKWRNYNLGVYKEWLVELCNHCNSSILIFSRCSKIFNNIHISLQFFLENVGKVREAEVKNWGLACSEIWVLFNM